jgi:hypothetical protein
MTVVDCSRSGDGWHTGRVRQAVAGEVLAFTSRYVWNLFFFVLAVVVALCAPYGLALLGSGWFLCLNISSLHMQRTW